jgi:hypothetical protein
MTWIIVAALTFFKCSNILAAKIHRMPDWMTRTDERRFK